MNNETFLIEPKNKKLWNQFLNSIPNNKKDIYYLPDYVNLYNNKICAPKCYIYKSKENVFFYPFIKRKILKTNFFDIITPYGYGGPIVKNYDKKFILEALNNYYGILTENNVICEQIKFHPLLRNVENLKEVNLYNLYMSCKTVTVDCKLDISYMLSKIYKKSNKELSGWQNICQIPIIEKLLYERDIASKEDWIKNTNEIKRLDNKKNIWVSRYDEHKEIMDNQIQNYWKDLELILKRIEDYNY